jgi:hypothetical protein
MAKKFKAVTFEEVQEELKSLIELSKKFEGFKIRLNLKDELQAASKLIEDGKEKDAIEATQAVSRGIKATLIGFFRGSHKHFLHLRGQIEMQINLNKDIRDRLDKALREEEAYTKIQLGIDLEKAAELYNLALDALRSAEKEQKERNEIRRKEKAEEDRLMEAQYAEAQRLAETKRRFEKAESLRGLASLMDNI